MQIQNRRVVTTESLSREFVASSALSERQGARRRFSKNAEPTSIAWQRTVRVFE